MAAKNDNITKDPVAAAKKGAITRTGRKKRKTIIRELLGFTSPERKAALEKRMDELAQEFLYSKNKKTRETIFKELMKYVHPQKKTLDVSASGGLNVVFYKPEKKQLDPPTDKPTK